MSLPGKQIETNGLRFHVAEEGTGPAVLLLHGFPDSSSLWRYQIPALVQVGFRVIAPDLRGFGESDKPAETEAYELSVIVNDVVGLLDALQIQSAHVVCHDWGAIVGWLLAALCPERVERLAALSVGHPACFLNPTIEQREKSWYILLFQWKDLAEDLLTRNDWQLFRAWVRNHAEFETWRRDLSRPGALAAGLNWYRANLAPERQAAAPLSVPVVKAPTLGIWSSEDAYLTEEQMLCSKEHVSGEWSYERLEGTSHWLQLDKPEWLNKVLIEFLKKPAS